jgi:hypothetical protein
MDAKWADGRQTGVAEGHKAGVAEGKSEAILAFLGARGVVVSDAARRRIVECKDVAVLERWITLAVTVVSADELVE